MENVDHKELEKFSHGNWWNKDSGPYALLHQLNPCRLAFVQSQVHLDNQKVVDLGCGGGIFSEALAQAHAKVTGIDLNQYALDQARAHAEQENLLIDYQNIAIERFAEKHPGEFNAVTCMELLEHVPQPEDIIAATAALLKNGGIAVFSTINRTPQAYLEAVVAAEYLLQLLPRGTHNYQNFIKPSELCEVARRHHLELIELNGLTYHPISKCFSLCPTPKTNYLVAFRKKSMNE
jgi:2-polyprenyl-6-hydroxyphenyl methylase/3-demethylubiquinone-9 3-methyltransferase